MNCPNCSKTIPENVTVCPYCGKPVESKNGRQIVSIPRIIGLVAALMVCFSAFLPETFGLFSSLFQKMDLSGSRKWIIAVSALLGGLSILSPRLEMLYPIGTAAAGGASANALQAAAACALTMIELRGVLHFSVVKEIFGAFSSRYSFLFLIGFLVMIGYSIVIVVRYLINGLGGKK